MPNNKLTVSEKVVPTVISIRNMSFEQYGVVTNMNGGWYVYRTHQGVLFLNDFDFLADDGERLKNSLLMVRILPKGTVIHMESTVTV